MNQPLPAHSVAVVVLNFNGAHHLPDCLHAALALAGLPGPDAVVVADNGSGDDSLGLLARDFPAVRVLAFRTNLGFADGNNRAAEQVEAEHLLFLNNDTAIHPDALGHLWAAVQTGATSAGARLLSWDERYGDFDGGAAAFTGHGHALGLGRPIPRSVRPAGMEQPEDRPHATLFNSGAAMLIRRDAFLRLGGFDPAYFAYYEDVDLGWRLHIGGHTVVHVPAARVRHRHGGTAGQLPSGAAARLYERNALATVAKNYSDANLARVLPAALALAAVRAGADPAVVPLADPVRSDPSRSRPVRTDPKRSDPFPSDPLPLPGPDWPGWPHLSTLDLDWGALAASRQVVQAARQRPDAEVLPFLALPFTPVPPTQRGFAAMELAVRQFGLEAIFGPWPPPARSDWTTLPARLGALWRAGGPSEVLAECRRYVTWRRAARP